jgi:hypothetical protein
MNNEFAFTRMKSEKTTDGNLKLTIFPREGSYKGMNNSRSYEIQVFGSLAPKAIQVNGKTIPYSSEITDYTWNFSGNDLTIHVYIPKTSCTKEIEILVTFSQDSQQNADIVNGVINKMNRLKLCVAYLKENGRVPDILSAADITDMKLTYSPMNCISEINSFNSNFQNISQVIQNMKIKEEVRSKALNYVK